LAALVLASAQLWPQDCSHGRALSGEGCPACGAEAGERWPDDPPVRLVHTFMVEWVDTRGRARETYLPASDPATAGATVAVKPECARVVDAIVLRLPSDDPQ
jgi:hypothetical protein